jgi:hypothetical protein
MTAALSRVLRAVRIAALALPLLVTTPAFAGYGTVTPATKVLPEATGGWKMALTVKLPKKPDPAYQTYRFFFTPVVLYETFLDDNKPGEQTRTLTQDKNTKPMVESLEVGFSDARNEVWDTTKFDFIIKRDRGFEAGKYKVEIRDTNDKTIGSSFQIELSGKNPVVDRRAMVMSGTPRKKVAADAPKTDTASAPAADAAPASDGTSTADPSGAPAAAPDAPPAEPPPPVKKGCAITSVGADETSGDGPDGSLALVTVLGVAALLTRRTRRSPD